ncbi:MAG: 3-deoxy-7-phosphoheptulonate synthase [Lachnospiraceae bacterium]|nr:3-deoxy-7-phosphoheptulonate synthase [Lachnospiraceae bacterium]
MNVYFEKKLAIPSEVKEMYPISKAVQDTVENRRNELKYIMDGKSDRFILIIGPCSADVEESVLDYTVRLRKLYDEVGEKIFIIPRVFTNKPRTTGYGYKGILHQPDPTGKTDLFKGIIATREMHVKVIEETGFTSADEMLYPENYKYLDDVLGYVSVGARSVENQQHRLTASGVDVPVGMKNPTGGDFNTMLNAIKAAQGAHSFIYRGWAAHSMGNPYAHAILRGYSDFEGKSIPNYSYEHVVKLNEMYQAAELQNPALIIDTNHGNSGKDPFKQPEIIKEVMAYRKDNPELKKLIRGFMVESYIEDGNQKVGEGIYGKSITDACLGWEKTEKLIRDLAEML